MTEPVPEVELEAEAEAETEPKKAKKPSRRRRRSRKKPAASGAEEVLTSDAAPDVVPEQHAEQENMASVALAETDSSPSMPSDMDAPAASSETGQLMVAEPRAEESERPEASEEDSSVGPPQEAPEPGSEESVAVVEAGAEAEQPAEPPASEESAGTAAHNGKPAPRKSLLQSYLPFS